MFQRRVQLLHVLTLPRWWITVAGREQVEAISYIPYVRWVDMKAKIQK